MILGYDIDNLDIDKCEKAGKRVLKNVSVALCYEKHQSD